VGYWSPIAEARLTAAARTLGLADQLVREGPKPQPEALAALRGSNVLVLIAGQNKFVRLGKLSPYLAAGRPILALGDPESETGRHVREAGHIVWGDERVDALGEKLVELYRTSSIPKDDRSAAFPFPHPHPLNWRTSAELLDVELRRLASNA
jgi:hypothetical protein